MDLNYTRTELAIMREEDRQAALAESFDEDFGPDWEENSVDPEFRRFVRESDVSDERPELDTLAAFEAHYG